MHECYENLLSQVHTYQTNSSLLYLCGAFDSRCSDSDFIPGVHDVLDRDVIDYVLNLYDNCLINFLVDTNVCILNGRNTVKNDFTFVGP